MVEIIRKIIYTAEMLGRRAIAYIKRNWKTVVYYASLAAVLMLIACAAENYRNRNTSDEEVSTPVMTEAAAEPAKEATETAPEYRFERPDGAQRIRDICSEPKWNEQLAQWEIHAGEDYCFPDDVAVSFSDGIIEYVSEEEGCVGVRSGSVYLKYGSVEPDESLESGKEIRQGERIGRCSDTFRGEGHMQKHLHLETFADGSKTGFDTITE